MTRKEIDRQIAEVKRMARLIIAALKAEREAIPKQKPKLPPMTKTQWYRYKNATYHKGMSRGEAIAWALRSPHPAGGVRPRSHANVSRIFTPVEGNSSPASFSFTDEAANG
jgi:hypothetical protein